MVVFILLVFYCFFVCVYFKQLNVFMFFKDKLLVILMYVLLCVLRCLYVCVCECACFFRCVGISIIIMDDREISFHFSLLCCDCWFLVFFVTTCAGGFF